MSTLQLKRLAIAVGVLLLLWGASALFTRHADQVRGVLKLPTLPANLTDTITITHQRDTVHLVQTTPTTWTANGHPATPGSVGELLKSVADTSPREIASVSASSLTRLGLDSTAWTLRVGPAARPRLTLLIGAGGGYGTAYVRLPGSDTAYLWRGTLPSLVQRVPDVWRDHHIASVPPDSIQSIAVTQHGRRYVVARQGKGWSVDGVRADSLKIGQLLAQFRELGAQGFGGPGTADSLARARKRIQRTVTIRGMRSTPLLTLTLDSGAAAGSFWATKAGDSTVYRLDNWQVIQLTPAGDSLRARR